MTRTYSVGVIAARTGVTIDALRYYEREGLIDAVDRDGRGHRRYSEEDAEWLMFLVYMRRAAMTIAQMRELVDLRRQGDVTLPQRLERFEGYREEIRRRIEDENQLLDVLDSKIEHYRDRIAGLPDPGCGA